jgi:hypothetical protein
MGFLIALKNLIDKRVERRRQRLRRAASTSSSSAEPTAGSLAPSNG